MKNKIIVFVLLLVGTGSMFAQGFDLGKLQKDMNAFSSKMAETLPFNSALGLNWADAYIGNFPHFGVGLFGGASFMDERTVNNLLGNFDVSLPSELDSMPLPAAGAEARLGGFVLPFDIGFKLGWLPTINFDDNIHFDYLMLGGDIRYAVMEQNVILPNITFGIGYNYIKGSVTSSMGGAETYQVGGKSITVADPDLSLNWSSHVIDLKLQVSKKILFITPSAGIGVGYSWSESGYGVKAETSGDIDEINSTLKAHGYDPIDIDNNGFSSIIKNSGWGVRLFAGLGFDIAVIKIDASAMYDFSSETWNAGLGIRLQL